MERTYKFKLYPKRKQVEVLDRTLMLCRHLYNDALEERIMAYKMAGKTLNQYEQSRELVQVKTENPEYMELYSHSLQDVLKRLDKAYRAFFRRVKNGETAGFPRFKGRNRFNSITYDGYGFRLRENGNLYATGIGTIRMFRHREIEGTPKTCIIKRDRVGDWWASISVALPDVPKLQSKTAIGVDVGLEQLAKVTDGTTIMPPKFLRASEEKIKILQRRKDRKVKGSQNRRKCVRRLAKAYRKVERQRDDYLHKASRALSQKADTIVFENLQIKNMVKNHHLAKSISDAGWGKLMQYTEYKAAEAGRSVVFVNANGTSQICSRCGEWVQKSLSERKHRCPNCGFSADRDYNAALNILGRLPSDRGELIKTPMEMLPPQLSEGGCV